MLSIPTFSTVAASACPASWNTPFTSNVANRYTACANGTVTPGSTGTSPPWPPWPIPAPAPAPAPRSNAAYAGSGPTPAAAAGWWGWCCAGSSV